MKSDFLRQVSRCTWHISSSGKRTRTGSAGQKPVFPYRENAKKKKKIRRNYCVLFTYTRAIRLLDFIEE